MGRWRIDERGVAMGRWRIGSRGRAMVVVRRVPAVPMNGRRVRANMLPVG